MTDSPSQERFKQFEALKQESAELLRLPADHQKVVLLAGLKLEHTRQLERLVDGQRVEPRDLLAVSEAIEKITPPLPPPKIEIEIIGDGVSSCPRCGWHEGERTGAPALIEGKAVEEIEPSKPTLTSDVPKPAAQPSAQSSKQPLIEKPKQSPKWQGEGDRAFMPAVNFVEGVEGWTRPSVWPSRGNSQALFGPHGGGLRANPPSPPPSQACQHKNHR